MKLSSFIIYDLVEGYLIEDGESDYVQHAIKYYPDAILNLGVPKKEL